MHTDVGSIRAVSWGVGVLAIGTLCTISIAVAGIISGSVSTNQSANAKITQLVISEPAAVAAGDFLLANIAVAGGSEANVTAPAGWTQILRTDNDTDVSVISYYKFASASEPASYVWSVDHQTNAEGGITAYSGVDRVNPIDVTSGNSGYGTVATTSPISTSGASEEVVSLFAADVGRKTNAGDYFSTPASTTEKYDVSNTPFGPSIASDDALQAAAGTSTVRTSLITGKKSRNWVTQQIALRLASPGIAFDSASLGDYQEGSATRTWSHTVSGTNTLLIVCGATYNTDFTGATYDGVAMTLLADTPAPSFGANTYMACYGLLSPHTGTHNVVLSRSGAFIWIEAEAESFSGVSQASLPSVVVDHQLGINPYVATLHTTVSNVWGLLYALDDVGGVITGGSGTLVRESNFNGVTTIGDSNGPWVLAGNHSLSMIAPSASSWDTILISFAPAN